MIKTLWSVTLYVSDLERAKRFYEETLGLEKKYEYSSYVGFECGGVEIGLRPKLEKGQKASPLSPTLNLLVEDAEEFYNELKRKGVRFTKELHEEPWGGKQATFTDPDGNTVEILQINWKKYFTVSAEGAKQKSS